MRDDTHAVISPYRNAVYSDAGYSLLGQVLARLSGKSYKDAIQGLLSEPLGLRDTTVGVPPDLNIDALNRSILTNTSAWGQDSQPVES
jgi:CubicO group peptidase (beta-lactamase class C family)